MRGRIALLKLTQNISHAVPWSSAVPRRFSNRRQGTPVRSDMIRALRDHWPEYLCEAAELGIFMISAGLFTILLWHPNSPVPNIIPSEFIRRMLTGVAMGSTAIALVFSPLGKRSGAHFNPAVTLTFWRLGKVKNLDAVFYIVAQFIGGIAGVLAVTLFV